jgi:hypothetical protein
LVAFALLHTQAFSVLILRAEAVVAALKESVGLAGVEAELGSEFLLLDTTLIADIHLFCCLASGVANTYLLLTCRTSFLT